MFTTGVDGLLRKTLESLYNEGKYTGDILILKYDYFRPSFMNWLKKHNAIIKEVSKHYKYMSMDRYYHYNKILKEIGENYDVLMHLDGNDIRIYEDINPLLKQAENKICVVPEDNGVSRSINREWDGWFNYLSKEDLDSEWWKLLKDKVMINGGMYAGPAKLVMNLLDYMVKEIDRVQTWGIDQAILNRYVYTVKPQDFKFMDISWDYVAWMGHFQHTIDGCIATIGDKRFKIKILHLVNIMFIRNKPWDKEIKSWS